MRVVTEMGGGVCMEETRDVRVRDAGGMKGMESPWFIFSTSFSADLMAAGRLRLRIQFYIKQ